MKVNSQTLLTFVLVGCAVVTTALVVRRELLSTPQHAPQKTVYVKDWRSGLDKGFLLGPPAAPIQLIEFADFECPFCAAFEQHLKSVEEKHPGQIAVTYVEFPLAQHRFAIPAARVVECAGEQGRFAAMHARLFQDQDQFGLTPWSEYAKRAGVPDESAFEFCIQKKSPLPRVELGKQWGTKLDIQGTPTVIINGWLLGRIPNADELDSMVRAILAGKSPVADHTA